MKVISIIEDHKVIDKIIAHLKDLSTPVMTRLN